jgi:Putative transposase
MTLSLDEFLRLFMLHLRPKGFVRIRHFGFLANRRLHDHYRFANPANSP